MGQLILFDIDGTIRGHNRTNDLIDRRLLPLLQQLKEQGYVLAIVTGRPYLFYKEYIDELLEGTGLVESDLPFTFVIYENGHRAHIDGVHVSLLSEQSRQEFDALRQLLDEKLSQSLVDKSGLPLDIAYAERRIQGDCMITIIDKTKALPSEEGSKYGVARDYLEELLLELGLHNLSVHTTSIEHMTIEAKDSTKRSAFQKLIAESASVTFCCDGKNDLELAQYIVEQSGTVVCPANAVDELKGIASFVSQKEHGGGVCEYLSIIVKGEMGLKPITDTSRLGRFR